jgi:hypothetical protein
MARKLDLQLAAAFEGGRSTSEANPFLYTSDCYDAFEVGRAILTRREFDAKSELIAASRRGFRCRDTEGREFVYRVSYILCTGGAEVWRSIG